MSFILPCVRLIADACVYDCYTTECTILVEGSKDVLLGFACGIYILGYPSHLGSVLLHLLLALFGTVFCATLTFQSYQSYFSVNSLNTHDTCCLAHDTCCLDDYLVSSFNPSQNAVQSRKRYLKGSYNQLWTLHIRKLWKHPPRKNPLTPRALQALLLLAAGTTVLFVRISVGLLFLILFPYYVIIEWQRSLQQIGVLTMMLADELLSRAVVLQRSNSSPMPAWLLTEVEIED